MGTKGDGLQQVISFITGSETSLVYPMNTVHLSENFIGGGKIHTAHEISHVIDNTMAGQLATFFGGGPADELNKFLGGHPQSIRWLSGNFDIKKEYEFRKPYSYGNNSYADYFAEAIAVWVFDSTKLPPTTALWLCSIVNLTK